MVDFVKEKSDRHISLEDIKGMRDNDIETLLRGLVAAVNDINDRLEKLEKI